MRGMCYFLVVWVISLVIVVVWQQGALTVEKKGETSSTQPKKEGEAMPIDVSTTMSATHPEFPLDMTCGECHPLRVDALSSATLFYLNNFKLLDREVVWEGIVSFLPGRERFVLATSYRNKPTATTVDFVLDPAEKALYAVCETGTQKLEQIKENPWVSMVRHEGWTVAKGGKQQWKSVQIEGRAEVVPSTDPRFESCLERYHLVRLSPERAKKRMSILKVLIDKVMLFDSTLLKSGYSIYQRWERGG